MPNSQTPKPNPAIFHKIFHSRKANTGNAHKLKPKQPPKILKKLVRDNYLLSSPNAVNVSFSKKHELSPLYKKSDDTLYVDQCFEVIEKIGEGSFGEVFKVRSKEDNKYYAVKKSKEIFRNLTDKKNKLEEVRKHEQIPKHPYCLRLYRAWEQREYLYIQLELCEMTLTEYSSLNHFIEEDRLWEILLDLLLAIKNLHDKDLIHLDIKLDNILVSSDNKCKLADFGLVFDLRKGNIEDAVEGDPKYLAPELMQGCFSKAADIFSIGIAILELAYDVELPSNGNLWHEFRSDSVPHFNHRVISPELLSVIHSMMCNDYSKRPTVDELLGIPRLTRIIVFRKFFSFYDLMRKIIEYVTHLGHIPLTLINIPVNIFKNLSSIIRNIMWNNMIPEIELNTSNASIPISKHMSLKQNFHTRSSSLMYLKELELDLLDSSGASEPEEEKDFMNKVEISPDKEIIRRLVSHRKKSGVGKRARNLMDEFKNIKN